MPEDIDPFLDATAMADLVHAGQVSPSELAEHAIRRIEAINPALNAVIIPTFEKARAEARDAEGPFRGVPYTLKDLTITSKGDPYTASVSALRRAGYRAGHDSYFTQRMRQAGFVLVGRTNTPELGISATTEPLAWGPCRNPWGLDRTCGASSGGAAVCVAAGMTPVAHGNDGGGSVRMPAALTGVVGLKPTRGRISTGPTVNVSDMVAGDAHEGLITRSIRDLAAMLDVVGGRRSGDGYGAPEPAGAFLAALDRRPPPLRIGFLDHDPTGEFAVDSQNAAAVREAAAVLATLGHLVEPAYPQVLRHAYAGWPNEFMRVISVAILREIEHLGGLLGRPLTEADVEPATWIVAEAGRAVSGRQYAEGVDRLRRRAGEIERWWTDDGWDLLLTPTTLIAEPPLLGRLEVTDADAERLRDRFGGVPSSREPPSKHRGLTEFLVPFNISGQPAISLPTHQGLGGFPIGLHMVGAFGREDLLLQVAAELERAFDWGRRRPPLFA